MININKKYLPFAQKQVLVDTIINSCIETKDEIYHLDSLLKSLFTNINLIEAYSDYKFNRELQIDEEYDQLYQTGEVKDFLNKLDDDEYLYIIDAIEDAVEYKLKQNNFESVIGRIGVSLLSKFDELIKNLTPESISALAEGIKSIDPKIAKQVLNVLKFNKPQ